MKLFITASLALLFVACSNAPQENKKIVPDSAKIEKNKQTAVLNEVGKVTRDAQSLERLGRDMDSYRLAADAESRRTCLALMEDRRRETAELETRIKNLPENFSAQFAPILTDLNECVSCSKQAKIGCVKARASINQTIKQIYP